MDEFSWKDAHSMAFIEDGWIRVEFNTQEIEPIDDYSMDDFLAWLDLHGTQILIMKKVRECRSINEFKTLAVLALANQTRMDMIRKLYEV